jgi:hypothetical protein
MSGSEEVAAYKASSDKCVMRYTSPSARLIGPQRIVLSKCIYGWVVFILYFGTSGKRPLVSFSSL